MMLFSFLFVWALLAVEGACTRSAKQQHFRPASRSQPYLDESFDEYVKATLNEWYVPGLSIAVVDGDDVYSKVDTENAFDFLF
jgi:hypothetical protein